MKQIELTKGLYALVDDADYARVNQHRWTVSGDDRPYARSSIEIDGSRQYMHRFILQPPAWVEVDHKNHNGLDNRKSNLRRCNRCQNARNTLKRAGCSSRFKGVSKHLAGWVAFVYPNGKTTYLGKFDREEDAAAAYDAAARVHFGEFANLNFPDVRRVPAGRTKKKAVLCTAADGTVTRYDSMAEAARATAALVAKISLCCMGRRKSAGGYRWEYA